MLTARLSEVWASLQSRPPQGGFHLQLLETRGDIRAFASLDASTGNLGLLFEVPASLKTVEGKNIRTRAFSVHAAHLQGLPAGRSALTIHLRDIDFSNLFTILCTDALDAFRNAPTTVAAAVALTQTIERWRLFVQAGARPLSEEEVRGLLGELTVLSRLVGKIGPSAALDSWENPGENLRDFQLPDASLEVKTYQADSGRKIRISRPEQLERDVHRPLFLAAVEIARVETTGRTLPEYIAILTETLPGEFRSGFGDKLATYRYLAAHADQYPLRYSVGPVLTFSVTEEFPRIRRAAIPAAVQDVAFSLCISDLEAFAVTPESVVGTALAGFEKTS
jgi:hypothetical protein